MDAFVFPNYLRPISVDAHELSSLMFPLGTIPLSKTVSLVPASFVSWKIGVDEPNPKRKGNFFITDQEKKNAPVTC